MRCSAGIPQLYRFYIYLFHMAHIVCYGLCCMFCLLYTYKRGPSESVVTVILINLFEFFVEHSASQLMSAVYSDSCALCSALLVEFALLTLHAEVQQSDGDGDGEFYQLLGPPMRVCVALQVFELVHVLIGWQRSPPLLPLITQVFSLVLSSLSSVP